MYNHSPMHITRALPSVNGNKSTDISFTLQTQWLWKWWPNF